LSRPNEAHQQLFAFRAVFAGRQLHCYARVVFARYWNDPERVTTIHHLLGIDRPEAVVGLDVRDDPLAPLGKLTDEDFVLGWDFKVPDRLFFVGLWRLRWNAYVRSLMTVFWHWESRITL
jgi:hypothetical protein